MLKKILWADFILGFLTAVAGLVLYKILVSFLGLPDWLILVIAAVTLLYSILAFILARQRTISTRWLRILVFANWIWTIISVIVLISFFSHATMFGAIFLVLQIIVVGGLAWLEGSYI